MAAPQPRHKRPGPVQARCLHRAALAAVAAAVTAVVSLTVVIAGQALGPLSVGVIAVLASLVGAALIVSASEAAARMHDRRVAEGRRCGARNHHPHP
ncbi:hypothetical protein [Actinomadura sp. WMMA1423]|uniref:hypothetical protein n=1 Tax=Actinomadura sp. WMMA1423 TaxID=2591108 RepID=UPI00114615D9|nr:hypothetical protein [Actinomadura sp. WMMA1423]